MKLETVKLKHFRGYKTETLKQESDNLKRYIVAKTIELRCMVQYDKEIVG